MAKQSNHYPLIAFAIGSLLLVGSAVSTLAQSQDNSAPSVAEAARRARERKKENTKPVRTFTNDDLPAAPPARSNQGTASAPANTDESAAQASGETAKPQGAAASDELAKQKKGENVAALVGAKKDLAQATAELDVMTRKAVLDADSYYSKTDFASDKEGKANLDAEAQQINEKKEAVEALKARVAELQELVGEEATADPDNNPPSPPPSSN